MRMTKQELTEHTLAVWQPRTARQLSAEDAREITENLTRFFTILSQWSRKEWLIRAGEAAERADQTDAGTSGA